VLAVNGWSCLMPGWKLYKDTEYRLQAIKGILRNVDK